MVLVFCRIFARFTWYRGLSLPTRMANIRVIAGPLKSASSESRELR